LILTYRILLIILLLTIVIGTSRLTDKSILKVNRIENKLLLKIDSLENRVLIFETLYKEHLEEYSFIHKNQLVVGFDGYLKLKQ